jgi:hypothetical protein
MPVAAHARGREVAATGAAKLNPQLSRAVCLAMLASDVNWRRITD